MNLIDNNTGKIVNVGDVVKCLADEPWIFVDIIDESMAKVMWDNVFYDMPVLALSCRVVQLPTARA